MEGPCRDESNSRADSLALLLSWVRWLHVSCLRIVSMLARPEHKGWRRRDSVVSGVRPGCVGDLENVISA